MKSPFLLLVPLTLSLAIAACGDDSSSSGTQATGGSSSSSASTSSSSSSSSSSVPAVTAQAAFDVVAAGNKSLTPAGTAVDPTTATDVTPSVGGSNPYFVPRTGITVDSLKAIMNDAATFPAAVNPVTVTSDGDTYTGYPLADVIVRATKFRPADYNTGAFGVTAAAIATGADGSLAVFSFTELIRTENGAKTIVAYEKNGAALPAAEGAMAVVAANDTDPALRKVTQLSAIKIRNEYIATDKALPGASTAALRPDQVAFTVDGAVTSAVTVTASTVSATSSQGYYAVDSVGTKSIADFKTYYFQEYGPRHMFFWWGQGIRLTDVLDTAGLADPARKNACFVVIRSLNNQPALFSCGELYNSSVGIGDGTNSDGEANRNRSQGVLLVTDDFREGTGNGVMMSCWVSLDNCTKTSAGDPTAYTTKVDANVDLLNDQFIALISTEDKIPFTPAGRWYPLANCTNTVWQCNAWIDVGERLQQGIQSVVVYYADAD